MAAVKKKKVATEVKLINVGENKERTFDFLHAENILRLQEKKGHTSFKLPDDSAYEFVEGRLVKRA